MNDLLVKAFPDIFEVAFTAQMEESLDEIEEGDRKWVETVREFYKPFAEDLKQAGIDMDDLKKGKPTDETCPQCGEGKLLEKWGRFGRFLACERYPECKYTRNLGESAQAEPEQAGITCDKCGRPMVFKQSRYGRFIGCSGYPECKNIKKITLGIPCPQEGCGGELTEQRSKRGRSYFGCSNYPDLPLRRVAAPGRHAVPEVRRALPDAARGPGQALRRSAGARAATTGARPRAREAGRRRAGRPRRRGVPPVPGGGAGGLGAHRPQLPGRPPGLRRASSTGEGSGR